MNYDKAVSEMLNVDGAIAAAVVDFASGMLLAGGGSPAVLPGGKSLDSHCRSAGRRAKRQSFRPAQSHGGFSGNGRYGGTDRNGS